MKLNRLLGAANRARLAVYLLAPWKLFKHADTPRAPKWLALAVLAYAVIPIDLIPHFIPVLGPLDDLMRLPLGIALAVKLAPDALWQARLCEAEVGRDPLPRLLAGRGARRGAVARRRGAHGLVAVAHLRRGLRVALVALAALTGVGAAAASETHLIGVVTHVSDGDTLWLKTDASAERPHGQRVKLRLVGLDAPERCQAHGSVATLALAARVQGQRVTVRRRATDEHGRALGTLWLRDEDVGAWLVREGHAWSARYRGDAGPYASEERAARAARRGLFAEEHPLEPRSFRREHGPCDAPPRGSGRRAPRA